MKKLHINYLVWASLLILFSCEHAGKRTSFVSDDGQETKKDIPSWVHRVPADSTNIYFVGESAAFVEKDAALEAAYFSALFRFGIVSFPQLSDLEYQGTESLKSSQSLRKVRSSLSLVDWTGIQEVSELGSPNVQQSPDGTYVVYRIFRWSKSDFEKSKLKLPSRAQISLRPEKFAENDCFGRYSNGPVGATGIVNGVEGRSYIVDTLEDVSHMDAHRSETLQIPKIILEGVMVKLRCPDQILSHKQKKSDDGPRKRYQNRGTYKFLELTFKANGWSEKDIFSPCGPPIPGLDQDLSCACRKILTSHLLPEKEAKEYRYLNNYYLGKFLEFDIKECVQNLESTAVPIEIPFNSNQLQETIEKTSQVEPRSVSNLPLINYVTETIARNGWQKSDAEDLLMICNLGNDRGDWIPLTELVDCSCGLIAATQGKQSGDTTFLRSTKSSRDLLELGELSGFKVDQCQKGLVYEWRKLEMGHIQAVQALYKEGRENFLRNLRERKVNIRSALKLWHETYGSDPFEKYLGTENH